MRITKESLFAGTMTGIALHITFSSRPVELVYLAGFIVLIVGKYAFDFIKART